VIRAFDAADTDAVVKLWDDCGLTRPWNDPHRDIERKLGLQPELFRVVEDDGHVIATAMTGFDGHRGWIYYLAVHPSRRGEGHARELISDAERQLIDLGCPKIMLMVRVDNSAVVELYEHLDYVAESTLVMGKRLILDGPTT
jgi:ribosomal protein S18 acetylase RimI-like enzyme